MSDTERLKRTFDIVMEKLPDDTRARLEAFWGKFAVPHEVSDGRRRLRPSCEVQETVTEVKRLASSPHKRRQSILDTIQDAVAMTGNWELRPRKLIHGQTDGVDFRFRRKTVETASDEMLQSLVAHELAHASRAASVGRRFPAAAISLGTTEDEEEAAADALLQSWGFDSVQLRRSLRELEQSC